MQAISDFTDRKVLVTGASSGIGRILCLELARRGADVALVARTESALDTLRQEIEDLGRRALVLPCDVADRARTEVTVQQALDTWGHIDMLVNNAGYGRHLLFEEWDLDDMDRLIDVNVKGSVYFTKLLLPQMLERGDGCIVFIASVAGKVSSPEESIYSASKHAIVGLADAVGMEVEDRGVYVLTVCPGAIDTPFFSEDDLARMPPVAKKSMVDPEDLVAAIFKALARGKHETTYPGFPATGYVVRALAPELMRRQVKRFTLEAVAKERARGH